MWVFNGSLTTPMPCLCNTDTRPAGAGPVLALAWPETELMEPRCHMSPALRVITLLPVLLVAIALGACRRAVPVIDTAPEPVQAQGTISGTVRGPEGTSAIAGRTVEVVNLETNLRAHATTNGTGGFSFKLDPGKYRVELVLRDGEAIVSQPGVIDVNRSDVDARADFMIGLAKVLRPRYPAPRGDDGLGAAIA